MSWHDILIIYYIYISCYRMCVCVYVLGDNFFFAEHANKHLARVCMVFVFHRYSCRCCYYVLLSLSLLWNTFRKNVIFYRLQKRYIVRLKRIFDSQSIYNIIFYNFVVIILWRNKNVNMPSTEYCVSRVGVAGGYVYIVVVAYRRVVFVKSWKKKLILLSESSTAGVVWLRLGWSYTADD